MATASPAKKKKASYSSQCRRGLHPYTRPAAAGALASAFGAVRALGVGACHGREDERLRAPPKAVAERAGPKAALPPVPAFVASSGHATDAAEAQTRAVDAPSGSGGHPYVVGGGLYPPCGGGGCVVRGVATPLRNRHLVAKRVGAHIEAGVRARWALLRQDISADELRCLRAFSAETCASAAAADATADATVRLAGVGLSAFAGADGEAAARRCSGDRAVCEEARERLSRHFENFRYGREDERPIVLPNAADAAEARLSALVVRCMLVASLKAWAADAPRPLPLSDAPQGPEAPLSSASPGTPMGKDGRPDGLPEDVFQIAARVVKHLSVAPTAEPPATAAPSRTIAATAAREPRPEAAHACRRVVANFAGVVYRTPVNRLAFDGADVHLFACAPAAQSRSGAGRPAVRDRPAATRDATGATVQAQGQAAAAGAVSASLSVDGSGSRGRDTRPQSLGGSDGGGGGGGGGIGGSGTHCGEGEIGLQVEIAHSWPRLSLLLKCENPGWTRPGAPSQCRCAHASQCARREAALQRLLRERDDFAGGAYAPDTSGFIERGGPNGRDAHALLDALLDGLHPKLRVLAKFMLAVEKDALQLSFRLQPFAAGTLTTLCMRAPLSDAAAIRQMSSLLAIAASIVPFTVYNFLLAPHPLPPTPPPVHHPFPPTHAAL